MRKIFLFAAVAAVALSSCSMNEITVNPTSADNAIGFSNYIGNSTKGSVVNGASINKSGSKMGVFAEYVASGAATGASNFMSNTEVTRGESDWTYSPLKFWPTTGTINFCAYYPYDGTTGHATAGTSSSYPSVYFEQNATLANMVDFVYATADNQTKSTIDTDGDTDGKVNFVFKHALSRIAFSAKAAADYAANDGDTKANGTYINVTKVEVIVSDELKVESNCDLKFSYDTKTIATVAAASSEKYYAKNTAWTIFENTTGCEINNTTATNLTTLSNDDATSTLVDATDAADATADKYIFLVPQKFAAVDYIDVEVTYTITTYDSSLSGGKIVMADNTKSVAMPAFTFAQGKAYNFPLVISLDAIEFGDVTVDAWGDETEVK